jgi:hypothetical protein
MENCLSGNFSEKMKTGKLFVIASQASKGWGQKAGERRK